MQLENALVTAAETIPGSGRCAHGILRQSEFADPMTMHAAFSIESYWVAHFLVIANTLRYTLGLSRDQTINVDHVRCPDIAIENPISRSYLIFRG